MSFQSYKHTVTGEIIKFLRCNGEPVGELGNLKETVSMIKSGQVSIQNGTVEDLIKLGHGENKVE